MPPPQSEELSDREEDLLLDELKEVANINEESGEIEVFASPSEVHAIGVNTIRLIGGWLLDRRRTRRARAASASGGDTSLADSLTTVN
jgi:hypothetical protein